MYNEHPPARALSSTRSQSTPGSKASRNCAPTDAKLESLRRAAAQSLTVCASPAHRGDEAARLPLNQKSSSAGGTRSFSRALSHAPPSTPAAGDPQSGPSSAYWSGRDVAEVQQSRRADPSPGFRGLDAAQLALSDESCKLQLTIGIAPIVPPTKSSSCSASRGGKVATGKIRARAGASCVTPWCCGVAPRLQRLVHV